MGVVINLSEYKQVAPIICNCCGKEIKSYNNFSYSMTFSYGSKRDLDIMHEVSG